MKGMEAGRLMLENENRNNEIEKLVCVNKELWDENFKLKYKLKEARKEIRRLKQERRNE